MAGILGTGKWMRFWQVVVLCGLLLSAWAPAEEIPPVPVVVPASDASPQTKDAKEPAIDVTAENATTLRAQAEKLRSNGNYLEAYGIFNALCTSPADAPVTAVGDDLAQTVQCLQLLNRINETDALIEKVIAIHSGNWRLLAKAAWIYQNQLPHYGFMISGEFERGGHRGEGRQMYSLERDRLRGLQLLQQARAATILSTDRNDFAQMLFDFANTLQQGRDGRGAWRLQILTDLSKLPDYEESYYFRGQDNQPGCPVDADGNPVFHKLPESWDAAASDGERWRWLLWQAKELNPGLTPSVMQTFADFWQRQLGVQTMANYANILWGLSCGDEASTGTEKKDDGDEKDTSGVYAIHTLGDNETIARTAIGIRRIQLPDEFNFIRIYQELAQNNAHIANSLANIYQNRRQYDKAVEWWKRYAAVDKKHAEQQINQILNNWGRFDATPTQAAGEGSTIDYTFRNGDEVSFTARRIDVDAFLKAIKEYLKTDPEQLDWQLMQPDRVGWRIIEKNQTVFLKETVAQWTLALKPRANHWDRRITVKTPLQKAGAYYVTGKMKNGNEARAILWVQDTAIVQKPMNKQSWYFVADAVTGVPLANMDVEFFGYHQRWEHKNIGKSRHHVDLLSFTEQTDKDGQVFVDPDKMRKGNDYYQWLVTAKDGSGRLAFLGYTHVWNGNWYDSEYNEIKQYLMTDRPVYRPAQEVKWKIWSSTTKYDQPDTIPFAGASFKVRIQNPKGDAVLETNCTADSFGGINGSLTLEKDATLGVYSVLISHPNNPKDNRYVGTFRVEEYKKPEFEVTVDAPTEPVMLGESFKAKVTAKYYMGLPVRKGKITYKVTRTEHDTRWYPVRPWDWFYGPGYWWFAYDYPWYPGWHQWGCRAPVWSWWNYSSPQPEVVASGDAELTEDGTFEIPVDTTLAKLIHGDQDHKYEITAEVTDESRRVITGSGSVIVARAPFKVYASVDRGYYQMGDTINASFNARTAAGKGVKGTGKATLYKISYTDNKPVETAVQNWDVNTDDNGLAELKLQASQKGQFRLSYVLTDNASHTTPSKAVT